MCSIVFNNLFDKILQVNRKIATITRSIIGGQSAGRGREFERADAAAATAGAHDTADATKTAAPEEHPAADTDVVGEADAGRHRHAERPEVAVRRAAEDSGVGEGAAARHLPQQSVDNRQSVQFEPAATAAG